MTRYIIPGGGLCNRIRVIKSAISISNNQSKIVVLWRVDSELGSKYENLFDKSFLNNDLLKFINVGVLHPFYWVLHPKILPFYKIVLKFINSNFKIILEDETKIPLSEPISKDIKTAKNILIHSYHCFFKFLELNEFVPISVLQKSINDVAANFNEHTVGIHIRRTDNQESIRLSPTSLFIDRMKQLASMNPATNFFLCTDDPSVKKELKGIFKEKIYTRDISYDRSKEGAIGDAIIDLYSLSKTHHLLCSHYSSFSEMATIIGHQPKSVDIIVKCVKSEKSQVI